jgi:flagellar biosynthetic protein FlhB
MKEEDQTEVASERRLQQMSEQGNIPMARDIAAMGAFGAALAALVALASTLGQLLVERVVSTVQTIGAAPNFDIWGPVALVGGAVCCAAAAGAAIPLVAQTQGRFWPHMAVPDLTRIWKPERLMRLATREGAVDLAAAFMKVGVLAYAMKWALKEAYEPMMRLLDVPSEQLVAGWLTALVAPTERLLAALVVIGATDFAIARWRFRRDTMMTRQESRREHREDEGDPMVRSRRKKKQREMAKHRVAVDVPRADAVIVNPTHIAIAVRYRKDEGGAPRVLAKGKGALAEVIRDIARAHGIAIIEDIPLARLLHKRVRVGGYVPKETFKAIATVLAHVYKLQTRK